MTPHEGDRRGTHYRSDGDGPPIVLIHGVGADLEIWAAVTKHLASSLCVIAYDMMGHGKSSRPPGPHSLGDYVRQLERLASDLALPSFDLLGFSMGGLVAQAFALAYPARVNRLILLNTVYDRSPEERIAVKARVAESLSSGYASSIEEAIRRWFTPAFSVSYPEVVEAMRQRMIANDRAAFAWAYAVFATADEELASSIRQIAAPTLVITGTDDRRSTPGMAARLASDLPHGSLRLLPGQRHMTPIEVPGDIARLVLEFLGCPVQNIADRE